MEVEDRLPVEHQLVGRVDQELDGGLVVQDHLGLGGVFAFGRLPFFDELPGVEQRIGVPLQVRRGPGEVDQQSVQDVARVGSRRAFRVGRAADPCQLGDGTLRQVAALVGPVLVEELAPVAYGRALCLRPLHRAPYLRP